MASEEAVVGIVVALGGDIVNSGPRRVTAIGTLNLGGAGSSMIGRLAPRVRNVMRTIHRLIRYGRTRWGRIRR